MREGFRQLLLTMTGFENAHRSNCSLSFPDKLIPGPCPHRILITSWSPSSLILSWRCFSRSPQGFGHGGTEGSWRPCGSGVSLFKELAWGWGVCCTGMGLLVRLHIAYPARARVAEGTVNTVPRWSLDRESTVSPCWKGRKNLSIKGWLRLKMEI